MGWTLIAMGVGLLACAFGLATLVAVLNLTFLLARLAAQLVALVALWAIWLVGRVRGRP